MKNTLFLLGLGSVLILSGCGGGGGSSGTTGNTGGNAAPAPVSTLSVVTAANATQVAGSAYASSMALTDSSAPLGNLLTGVSVGGARISVLAPALDLVRKVYPRTTPLLTGVTMTEACSGGGSMTVEANLRNEQMMSNGDTLKITANNCIEDGAQIGGVMAVTMSNITGDILNSYTWSATLDTTFTNFVARSGAETAGVNGDMKIAMTQTSSTSSAVTVSGKSLKLTEQRNGTTLGTYTLADYSMSGSEQGSSVSSAASFTIAGTTAGLGQFSYSVKNLQPFVSTGASNPHTGALIVNGAASSVTLTAVSTSSVRLDFSVRGDGVTTQSSNLSWDALLAAL